MRPDPTTQAWRFWKNWTISTRISAIISLGVIASIVVIGIGMTSFLKREYLASFGKQQFTTLQAFATYLDADLTGKLKALTDVAAVTPPEALTSAATAQNFLANRVGILSLFDDGLMLLSAEGRLLAEMPLFISDPRITRDYSASAFFEQARKADGPIVSEPFYSMKPRQRPIVEMMAPIDNGQGKRIGYLCGGLTLTGDNALGNITRRAVGERGYFYVYSRDRTILVHRDPSRTLQKDVPPGVNRLFDRAIQGFVGSGETVSSRGLHLLASYQPLQAAPWILTINLPMQEVLTPFYANQRMIILVVFLSGLWVLLVSWWSLMHFMAPLERFIGHMRKCGVNPTPFTHTGGPELTLLATIFNQMLARLHTTQAELAANEELQRTLLNTLPDLIFFKNGQGCWLLANQAALTLFRLSNIHYQGKTDAQLAVYTPSFRDALLHCEQSDKRAWGQRSTLITEETLITPDGRHLIYEVSKSPLFHPDGSPKALVVIGRDITNRKKREEHLRKLSKAVEQSPVSTVITDTTGAIEFVNPQFTNLTGYTFDEAIGQNPRILKTDRTPPEVFVQLWQTISSGRIWEGELYNKKKDGEEFTERATISPIFDEAGNITHYMAIKVDITAKKLSEEIIWRQANFDHLTNLPNRRLFLYRLQNAIPYAEREAASLVLMFLDLDHFKEVNDTLGHDYGDLLLIEAAHRIRESIRDTDTVSRFGGDEFVLMLTRIKIDAGIDKVTRKILAALDKPFHLKDQVARVTASIGVTICPQDGTDVSTLMRNADRAMYLAKNAGRNCWRSFTDLPKE